MWRAFIVLLTALVSACAASHDDDTASAALFRFDQASHALAGWTMHEAARSPIDEDAAIELAMTYRPERRGSFHVVEPLAGFAGLVHFVLYDGGDPYSLFLIDARSGAPLVVAHGDILSGGTETRVLPEERAWRSPDTLAEATPSDVERSWDVLGTLRDGTEGGAPLPQSLALVLATEPVARLAERGPLVSVHFPGTGAESDYVVVLNDAP